MMTLWQDVRYGLRMLWKNPGFTLVAVISLALGIGLNTSIFSLVNSVLIRPLPLVREPERLVWLRAPASYPDYLDYREQTNSFQGMAAMGGTEEFSLRRAGEPELVRGEYVTANYFSVLGVEAAQGRTFGEEEDDTPAPVAVISHRLWQTRFDSDPAVVGRQTSLNGMPFTVVGVAPKGFIGSEVGLDRELWVPLSMQPQLKPEVVRGEGAGEQDILQRRNTYWLNVIARLKPGAAREQAEAELAAVARRLNEPHGGSRLAERLRAVSLVGVSGGLDPRDRDDALPVAGLLMAVVGLVLLIACANVASLLLARAAARRRETAVRQALGASRPRLARQWLTESVLLALLGGAAGLLLALWSNDLLASYARSTPIASLDLGLDRSVLTFTLAVSVLTGLVFGLAPALQASRLDLVSALKGEGAAGTRSRLRGVFVTTQVTLSVVLLVCAGLFIRSLREAHAIDPGFEVERALLVPVDLGLLRYDESRGQDFYRELVGRVGGLPGIEGAGLMRFEPLGFSHAQREVYTEATGGEAREGGQEVGFNVVGEGYFRTMGIAILRGREFDARDGKGAPGAVVINQTLAERLWPGEDPLGKRLSFEGPSGPYAEVVGVARDAKYATLGERARAHVYQPLSQSYEPKMTLVARTVGDPRALADAVRGQVRALDANLPVPEVKTLGEQVALSLFPSRAAAWVLGGFGLLALALAATGIYGVVSYTVAQRTREIGIRVALGARARDVFRLVLGKGLFIAGVGVAAGLALSLVVTRLAASFLYGVGAADPLTFAGVALVLIIVALAASYVPARRATKVDPMTALRYE